jgi:hypothetical protein
VICAVLRTCWSRAGRTGDGGSFFPFGDDLEEQFGAAGVELDGTRLVGQEQV